TAFAGGFAPDYAPHGVSAPFNAERVRDRYLRVFCVVFSPMLQRRFPDRVGIDLCGLDLKRLPSPRPILWRIREKPLMQRCVGFVYGKTISTGFPERLRHEYNLPRGCFAGLTRHF